MLPFITRIVPRLFLVLLLLPASSAFGAGWIIASSYYSHDPQTGERVTQYAQPKRVEIEHTATYVRSGYRHTESRLRVGGSADRLHVTEEWGNPVRPYGEWARPYRPYSVPYDAWGPPFGGLTQIVPPFFAPFPNHGHTTAPHPHHDAVHHNRFRRDHDRHRSSGDVDRGNRGRHDHRVNRGFKGSFRHRETTDEQFFWPRAPREHPQVESDGQGQGDSRRNGS